MRLSDPTEFNKKFLHPRYWPSWLLLGFLGATVFLPRAWSRWLGARLGWLFYRLNSKRRRIARINLEICFPDCSADERAQMLIRHYLYYGQCVMDLAFMIFAKASRLHRLSSVAGMDILLQHTASKRNLIFFVPHILAVDYCGVFISQYRHMVSMMKPLYDPVLNWAVSRGRSCHGARMVLREQGLGRLVRAVGKGSMLYYIPDEDFGLKDSVFAPFFNIPTATLTTLGRMARITHSTVIPITAYVKDDGGYQVHVFPPLENFPGDNPEDDAALMNKMMEQCIRLAPDQYMWTQRWFKTQQTGGPSPYD